MSEVEDRLRSFMAGFFKASELGRDEDIFRGGFVNSLFAIQLVSYIEKEFTLKIEDDDLDIENFRTLAAMTAFVERKKGS